jgi:hypothetical protein
MCKVDEANEHPGSGLFKCLGPMPSRGTRQAGLHKTANPAKGDGDAGKPTTELSPHLLHSIAPQREAQVKSAARTGGNLGGESGVEGPLEHSAGFGRTRKRTNGKAVQPTNLGS